MEEELGPFTHQPSLDPSEHVIARYGISNVHLDRAARRIAAEATVGTWTGSSFEEREIFEDFGAKVFRIDERESAVEVAIPCEIFDPTIGGIPQLLSVIAGKAMDLTDPSAIRLIDVSVPSKYVSNFSGPKFGVEGVRRILGIRGPLIGVVIKPKLGLMPSLQAKAFYEAALGGADIGADGEGLVSQPFSPIEARASHTADMIDRIRGDTGRKAMYAINVTAEPAKMLDLADRAIESGANAIMVNAMATGLSSLQILTREPSVNVPVFVDTSGRATSTRPNGPGISMRVIAKLVRMIGGDLIVGSSARKQLANFKEVKRVNEALLGDFHGLEASFPVAYGGIHPGVIEANVSAFGKDQVLLADDGIFGHPWGTQAGAAAARQAMDATMRGEGTLEAARVHDELRVAVEKWGYTPPEALM